MSAISDLADAVAVQWARRMELPPEPRRRHPFKTPWDAFTAPDAHPLLKRLRAALDARGAARLEVTPP